MKGSTVPVLCQCGLGLNIGITFILKGVSQEDSAPHPHSMRAYQILWLSHLPDLNPIKYLWEILNCKAVLSAILAKTSISPGEERCWSFQYSSRGLQICYSSLESLKLFLCLLVAQCLTKALGDRFPFNMTNVRVANVPISFCRKKKKKGKRKLVSGCRLGCLSACKRSEQTCQEEYRPFNVRLSLKRHG